MSRFRTIEDIAAYPAVTFRPRPYYVSFGLDYNTTPKRPHVVMLFHPSVPEGEEPSGAHTHWHVPLSRREAKALHTWLGKYLADSSVHTDVTDSP